MTTTEKNNRVFRNDELKKAVEIAKTKGYKVYTFESSSKYINQIFIENQKGQIGTISEYYSGVHLGTIHKIKRDSGNGTGFGGLIKGQDINFAEDLDMVFINSPYWTNASMEKYTSFEEYRNHGTNKILTYYEI